MERWLEGTERTGRVVPGAAGGTGSQQERRQAVRNVLEAGLEAHIVADTALSYNN